MSYYSHKFCKVSADLFKKNVQTQEYLVHIATLINMTKGQEQPAHFSKNPFFVCVHFCVIQIWKDMRVRE